jgi:hypothetical protein
VISIKSQEPEAAWNVFNALCQKVGGRIVVCFTCSVLVQTLMSANHILHGTVAFIICPAGILFTYVPADGEIKRDPVILEDVRANSLRIRTPWLLDQCGQHRKFQRRSFLPHSEENMSGGIRTVDKNLRQRSHARLIGTSI